MQKKIPVAAKTEQGHETSMLFSLPWEAAAATETAATTSATAAAATTTSAATATTTAATKTPSTAEAATAAYEYGVSRSVFIGWFHLLDLKVLHFKLLQFFFKVIHQVHPLPSHCCTCMRGG